MASKAKKVRMFDGSRGPRKTPPYGSYTGEAYIYALPDGRFHVPIGLRKRDGGSTTLRRSFKSLTAARRFRDEIKTWHGGGLTAEQIRKRLLKEGK